MYVPGCAAELTQYVRPQMDGPLPGLDCLRQPAGHFGQHHGKIVVDCRTLRLQPGGLSRGADEHKEIGPSLIAPGTS